MKSSSGTTLTPEQGDTGGLLSSHPDLRALSQQLRLSPAEFIKKNPSIPRVMVLGSSTASHKSFPISPKGAGCSSHRLPINPLQKIKIKVLMSPRGCNSRCWLCRSLLSPGARSKHPRTFTPHSKPAGKRQQDDPCREPLVEKGHQGLPLAPVTSAQPARVGSWHSHPLSK